MNKIIALKLGLTPETEFSEEYVARFLWGHESHDAEYTIGYGGSFLQNPCIKEPIISAFGKISPDQAICNRNISPKTWKKLFLFAEKTKRIWNALFSLVIPDEEKLFLMFDKKRAELYQYDALRFTKYKTWQEFILNRPAVITPTPYHTHPKILEACADPINFAKLMISKNGNMFRGTWGAINRLESND